MSGITDGGDSHTKLNEVIKWENTSRAEVRQQLNKYTAIKRCCPEKEKVESHRSIPNIEQAERATMLYCNLNRFERTALLLNRFHDRSASSRCIAHMHFTFVRAKKNEHVKTINVNIKKMHTRQRAHTIIFIWWLYLWPHQVPNRPCAQDFANCNRFSSVSLLLGHNTIHACAHVLLKIDVFALLDDLRSMKTNETNWAISETWNQAHIHSIDQLVVAPSISRDFKVFSQ